MSTQPHPNPDRLAAYLLGRLAKNESAEIAAHLAECDNCRSRAASLDSNVAPGPTTVSYVGTGPKTIVAGHELHRELARGGLGVVYLAYHPHLLDYRAIKRPQMKPSLDRDLVLARFRREVQAVGSLRHDHVIRAHDAGADADGPYLVMEYLDGEPLSRLIRLRGPLPGEQACELVRQAARGLQAAHERGLVHRDVKPSNLMLARTSAGTARVVVIDWGLVKRANELSSDGVTVVSTALGTPDYMSPEQIRDAHSVDIRADIYSLGVTLYFLLAGKAPFQDRTDQEKLAAHQREALPPITRSDLPRALLTVLKGMVEKDPARRYSTPAEVVEAVQPFCTEARLFDLLERKETPRLPPILPRRVGCWVSAAAALAAVLLLASVSLGLLVWKWSADKPHVNGNAETIPGILGNGPIAPEAMSDRHSGLCSSLVFTSDGLFAISENGGGEIFVWDLMKRRRKEPIHHGLGKPFDERAGVVAVSPDGKLLAAASNDVGYINLLRLYDQKTIKSVGKEYHFKRLSHAMAFSPDGTNLAVVELPLAFEQLLPKIGGFGQIRLSVVDIEAGKWKHFPLDRPVNNLAYSPDGKLLVTCSDGKTLRVWNMKEARIEREFAGHDGGADQIAFSGDGKHIYSASSADDTLRVWDNNEASAEVKRISYPKTTAKMTRCTFWNGGRALTAHTDGSVILWDLETQAELKRFPHNGVQITAIVISPDGHHALAAHSDHSVYLYRLPAPAKPR